MKPQQARQDSRIDLRLYHYQKATIEEAARIQQQDLSDFARNVLLEHARSIIETENQVILSSRDREIFLNLLDSEVEPNEALKEAFSWYSKQKSQT